MNHGEDCVTAPAGQRQGLGLCVGAAVVFLASRLLARGGPESRVQGPGPRPAQAVHPGQEA
jgi:hypothetical protein